MIQANKIRFFFIYFLLIPIDILIGGILLFSLPFMIFFTRVKLSHRAFPDLNNINVLRIMEGGDLESIFRKYKNLNSYLRLRVPNLVKLDIISNFFTKNHFFISLDQNTAVMETFCFKQLPLTSVLLFVTRHIRIIQKYNIHLIHGQSPFFIGYLALWIARLSGIPFCISIHSNFDQRLKVQNDVIPRIFGSRYPAEKCEAFCYKNTKLILPRREEMVPRIMRFGGDRKKIRYLTPGTDVSLFKSPPDLRVLEKYNISSDQNLLFGSARFESENYIDDYIEIARELYNHRKDWILLIGGTGSRMKYMREKIKEYHLQNNVILPGFISFDDVIHLKKLCKININLVGGYSLIESCLSGNPVLCYDVEWHYELIRDESMGLRLQKGDYSRAAIEISRLLDQPNLASAMGEKAKTFAMENYSLEKEHERYANSYKELLTI